MARVKTYTAYVGDPALAPESAKIRPGELDQMQDDYEASFGNWRRAHERYRATTATFGNGTELALLHNSSDFYITAQGRPADAFHIDPSHFTGANGRIGRVRLTADAFVGNPTGCTLRFQLRPIVSWSETGDHEPTFLAGGLGVTVGNTVTLDCTVANTRPRASSLSFAMPTAGWYAMTYTVATGSLATALSLACSLEYQVS
jgi:hypothetical protein